MDRDFGGAKEYVFRLLALRPRTEKEIIIKMKQKGFDQDVIAGVISLLTEYNYINDTDFVRVWVKNRCLLKPMGKRRLSQELYQKGVAKEIIAAELTRLSPEMEYGMARKIVDRKLARGKVEPRRLYSFLLRRGFSPDVINKILLELNKEFLPE